MSLPALPTMENDLFNLRILDSQARQKTTANVPSRVWIVRKVGQVDFLPATAHMHQAQTRTAGRCRVSCDVAQKVIMTTIRDWVGQ